MSTSSQTPDPKGRPVKQCGRVLPHPTHLTLHGRQAYRCLGIAAAPTQPAEPLSSERRAEIRQWRDELGSKQDVSAVGPYNAIRDLLAENERLTAELAKYVGHEPTIAEEVQYLHRSLNAVYDLCDEAKRQGITSGGMFTVAAVEEAADGNWPDAPKDNRRRIYLDGKGHAWIDACQDTDGTQYIVHLDPIALGEDVKASNVRERTGSLREIGRTW